MSSPALSARPALLFDLDGTLVDSVYQHVLAWREALHEEGLDLSVWRIHRRIGMSGGLFLKALERELGASIGEAQAVRIHHRQAFDVRIAPARRPQPRARDHRLRQIDASDLGRGVVVAERQAGADADLEDAPAHLTCGFCRGAPAIDENRPT